MKELTFNIFISIVVIVFLTISLIIANNYENTGNVEAGIMLTVDFLAALLTILILKNFCKSYEKFKEVFKATILMMLITYLLCLVVVFAIAVEV